MIPGMSRTAPFRAVALLPLLAPLAASAAVSAPVLKWQKGGCVTSSYCQTGWYASPAVADLDGDGTAEVVWASYDLTILDGATGTLEKRTTNAQRAWPGIVVADLTASPGLEIVVGRGGNQVALYDRTGTEIWTRNPWASGEVRTLAVDDFENDGTLEIVVGRAAGAATQQVNVYEPDGTVRPGWPARHASDPGYGWGMYNENVAIGDLDGNGQVEIYNPTDTHYITALDPAGNQIAANAMYGSGKVWSQVGVHVDQAADLRGYADCGIEHRPNFANCAPAIGDVDGNGTLEFVTTGDVYDCSIGDPDGDLYVLPWILKRDRTRWSNVAWDWTNIPLPGASAGPLSEDYTVLENAVHNTVLADLDGDGNLEILYPSYDGKLHAFWLDRTEHGSWPFVVPGAGIRFAGEPVVADLDDDGQAEVIVGSWPQKGFGYTGKLTILSSTGTVLQQIDLPLPVGSATWNGALGAPTIANIDADADYELVVGTSSAGVVAYDLPGSSNARILWGTGRGSSRRTGRAPTPIPVEASRPGTTVLRASKQLGTAMWATFAPACGARDHAIYWGNGPISGSVAWTGVSCGQGTDGVALFDPGATGSLLYFVAVGQTSAAEGSYGRNSAGAERPESTGLPACNRPQMLTGSCP
jgi:hypothetical protein